MPKNLYGTCAYSLQPLFERQRAGSTTYPYSDALSARQVRSILARAVKQSDRYRVMKAAGYSEDDIRKAFRTRVPMTVFSYYGDVDTVMTPLDSIRYYKSFLRSGFIAIDPLNGHVKAYVAV